MIKLKPGDYVSTKGMTEEQHETICQKFMDAGAEKGEYGHVTFTLWKFVGWDEGGVFYWDNSFNYTVDGKYRELTINQILGESKMTIEEAYQVMQDNCGIDVGDTVKIRRKAKDGEMGWNNQWGNSMYEFIGKRGIVKHIWNTGIGIYNEEVDDWFNFPFFVLELVKKGTKPINVGDYDCRFNNDGSIDVGRQHIEFDKIEEIYNAAKKMKENN